MIVAVKTGSMTHSQESRVSSTQDNFRLSEESRSSVSALVSRLNSSALGVDLTENEKLRGGKGKSKEQKMQDPFPWMPGFCNICQATVGSRNVKHLENLMNIYIEHVTPNVKECYTKPNRAAKLKKSMSDTLVFFHLFYQEIKEALEHSFYLDKMTVLISMYMDMEIKASIRGKRSFEKVAARLTSSLYIFLDNSEEHMLDAILMTKFVHKNYRDICHRLLKKLLNNISTYPMYEMLYVRCLLTFKLWKKIVPDAEERKCINMTAMQKLHAPPNLMENIKAMGNVLPRIPKTKKNITLFLMQSNFNLKSACQEFLKSVKKSQKAAYSQGLGSVEIDKPLFFVNRSGNTSPRLIEKEDEGLIEKEDESDSGCCNNLINDIWSSISTVNTNVPQTKRLKELHNVKTVTVNSPETPKKKKKVVQNIKKGKKKKILSSGTKPKKKKKSLKSSESTGTEKEGKKLKKVKNKKKKKKRLLQVEGSNQVNIKQSLTQVDECNQVKVKQALTQVEECHQVVIKSSIPQLEECNEAQVKTTLPQVEEFDQVRVSKIDSQAFSCVEDSKEERLKQPLSQTEECEQGKIKQTLPQVEECDQVKVKALLQIGDCDQLKIKQAFLQIGELDQVKKEDEKLEPQLDRPKTEKFESLLAAVGQIQEAEISSKVEEPLVKKVKVECISSMCIESQFDIKKNDTSETMEQVNANMMSNEKLVNTLIEFGKAGVLADKSVIPSEDLATKSDCKDKVESVFDNSKSDLFTIEKGKDMSSEKEDENLGMSTPIVADEGKVVDYEKCIVSDNSVPVSAYAVAMEICDSSMKREVCDNSGEMETSDINKPVQIETDSEVEILDELKPQEGGRCDVSASEEEIVLCDDGDLLPDQRNNTITFATGNEDLLSDLLGCSERQYPMSRDVLSVESMGFETENPPVSNELEPEPSANMAVLENTIVGNYLYGIDHWIPYDRNNPAKHYEYEFPVLPRIWMEDEEDDDVQDSDLSKSFETSTPKRGMGKMSYHDVVMSDNRQKEFRASTSGRHNSHGLHMNNSSESGSALTGTSPLLTSSASGSSSPRSESAMEGIESVCQDNMESCDNLIKSSELSVSSERIPDTSNMRYYNSNYQKSSETQSQEKESFNSQSSYGNKIGDCRMDNARVVVETLDHNLVNRVSQSRLTPTSSESETSSNKNVGTSAHQSPERRKKPGKLHPEHTDGSQNASEKQGAGEYSMSQSRSSIRGRRRRGRPPCRGRGVSSNCKVSSDTKSSRKQGCNGKGNNDPEFNTSQPKKSRQYDPPLTRSISKRFGISETDNMFDRL